MGDIVTTFFTLLAGFFLTQIISALTAALLKQVSFHNICILHFNNFTHSIWQHLQGLMNMQYKSASSPICTQCNGHVIEYGAALDILPFQVLGPPIIVPIIFDILETWWHFVCMHWVDTHRTEGDRSLRTVPSMLCAPMIFECCRHSSAYSWSGSREFEIFRLAGPPLPLFWTLDFLSLWYDSHIEASICIICRVCRDRYCVLFGKQFLCYAVYADN